MNLFTKQKQTHRHREQTCGSQGGRGMGGWIGSLGLADENYYILQSTGNYIQYPVINHNGKGYEKRMYIN